MTTRTLTESESYFRSTLGRIRAGDEHELWKLIEEYQPAIRRVIRRKLGDQMRSSFDSFDFVQMAWTSFFVEPEKIHSFERPEQLMRHLIRIATNKIIDEFRRGVSQKHGGGRGQSLDDSRVVGPADPRGTTPSQVAVAREQWERLMEDASERDKDILRLRMGGATYDEIAEQLGIAERTARRVIERMLRSQGLGADEFA